MSTEQGEGSSSKQAATEQQPTERSTSSTAQSEQTTRQTPQHPTTPPKLEEEQDVPLSQKKPAAKRDQASESTSPSTPEDAPRPRQVIAVSASKGPAAFFNLARKFLVTDEECDLSALEGAIVSAVDAAHLLERSKLAIIVRYVSVPQPSRLGVTFNPWTSSIPFPVNSRLCQPYAPTNPWTASLVDLVGTEYKHHTYRSNRSDGSRNTNTTNRLSQVLLHLPHYQKVLPLKDNQGNTRLVLLHQEEDLGDRRAVSFDELESLSPSSARRVTSCGWNRIHYRL